MDKFLFVEISSCDALPPSASPFLSKKFQAIIKIFQICVCITYIKVVYFISFMYDRFYDLYHITILNVRLVNYLRISPPFHCSRSYTIAFRHANKLFPRGNLLTLYHTSEPLHKKLTGSPGTLLSFALRTTWKLLTGAGFMLIAFKLRENI